MRKIIFTLILLLLCIGCVLFLSPSQLVVDSSGNITTIVDRLGAEIQGGRFWVVQLRYIDAEIIRLKTPVQLPKSDDSSKVLEDTDRLIADIYKDYPQLRPSTAEQKAELLRDEADRIESAEIADNIEQYRLQRISTLEKSRPLIASRASVSGM